VTSIDVKVRNPSGLHARPAARLVKAASAFSSRIRLENRTSGQPAEDAKSLLRVLACGVAMGHHVRITTEGVDEEEAVSVLRALIDGGLGEPPKA
jgi:phosphotransferase system HPr (HPr) family protein